ncbi:MAG: hypothetical protein IIV43_05625, partial [Oscillospiraceae bacterium]|nr:hypothetical protein [Oscillospiraceae bacterium]
YTVAYDLSNQTMYIRPYDTVVWTSLSMDEITAETRTQYPIYRGEEGQSVASLSLNASEEEAAPVTVENPINTGLVVGICVLGLAVVVLLIKLGKKEDAMAK